MSDEISKKKFKDLYRMQMKTTVVYCCLCGKPITREKDLSLEHRLPKHRGGVDTFANWDVSHKQCNNTRGALTMEEWFQWLELEKKRHGHTR